MTTGEKIEKCRKQKGMTQLQLAQELGVTRQAVSRWESDLAFPETDKLASLGKLFGVSVDWLLNYNSEEPSAENGEEYREYRIDLKKFHIEYKSKAHIGKLPLVHINIGLGRTAKGVVAVGLKSVGVLSLGIFSLGVISIGTLGLGIFSLSCFALGIFSAGAISVGIISLGAIAIGLFAMGAVDIGLFAIGAYSVGYFIAIGDTARGGIALGGTHAYGSVISVLKAEFEAMKDEIYSRFNELPAFWSVFIYWCKSIFNGVLNGIITLGS